MKTSRNTSRHPGGGWHAGGSASASRSAGQRVNFRGVSCDIECKARLPAGGRMNDIAQQLERHYIELGPMLLAYFRRQRRIDSAADDLLQETFLRAWRERARFESARSPRAYLFGIARHVCLDAQRRVRATEPLERDLAAEPPPAADDRVVGMRAAIAALPATHREPLLLKLQQELSYAEIAEVLGLPIGTVRSRLHYAVEQLQRVLNPPTVGATRPETTYGDQGHER